MLDLVISPSLTVNRECPDRPKLNLSNVYATAPDDIEGRLPLLLTGFKMMCLCVYIYIYLSLYLYVTEGNWPHARPLHLK